jgi:hypothetical protein
MVAAAARATLEGRGELAEFFMHEVRGKRDASVARTFFGGKRLFDGIDPNAAGLEIIEGLASPMVTHLRCAVKKKR